MNDEDMAEIARRVISHLSNNACTVEPECTWFDFLTYVREGYYDPSGRDLRSAVENIIKQEIARWETRHAGRIPELARCVVGPAKDSLCTAIYHLVQQCAEDETAPLDEEEDIDFT